MNIENLEVGKIFKNYKALCEVLCESVKTGNAKKAQLSEWERNFSYSKQGNKFIIETIYNEPLEKEENRGGANNTLKHAQKMEDTLMYLLDKEEDKVLFLTVNRLLLKMNMVNCNFSYGNRNKKKVSNYLNIEEAFVEEFFNATKRTLNNNIESMLNRLKRRALIHWYTVKMICVATTRVKTNELGDIKVNSTITYDEFDNEQIDLSVDTHEYLEYRIATDEEIELILEVEGLILDELNCKGKSDVVVKDKWQIFVKKVNDMLFERANIRFHYDSYKIIKNEKRLSREAGYVDEIMSQEEMMNALNILTLNLDVQYQLMENIERRRERTVEKAKNDQIKDKYNIRLDDNYVENGYLLIENFINSNQEDITNTLKYTKVS